jgi:aspartate beta-hydroxylase
LHWKAHKTQHKAATISLSPPPSLPTPAELEREWEKIVVSWFGACAGSGEDITQIVARFEKNVDQCKRHPDLPLSQSLLLLARKVFLAYCALDSGRVAAGRSHLVATIAELEPLLPASRSVLKSAVMELKLSYDDDMDMANSRKVIQEYGRLIDYSNPMQRPGHMVPLTARAFWDPGAFPFVAALEENFAAIAAEIKLLTTWHAVGGGDHRAGGGTHDASVLVGDWREVVLFGTGATPGVAPNTVAILRQHLGPDLLSLCSGGGGEIIFSKLAAGSQILPHCAPTNHRLTCHLGIAVPPPSRDKACAINVGGEWREWSRGKCLVFDDSFEHAVRNDTREDRVILLIRFWHPELSGAAAREEALSGAMEEKERALQERWVPPLDLTRAENAALAPHLPVKEAEDDVGWVQGTRCGGGGGGGGLCRFGLRFENERLVLRCSACGRDRLMSGNS